MTVPGSGMAETGVQSVALNMLSMSRVAGSVFQLSCVKLQERKLRGLLELALLMLTVKSAVPSVAALALVPRNSLMAVLFHAVSSSLMTKSKAEDLFNGVVAADAEPLTTQLVTPPPARKTASSPAPPMVKVAAAPHSSPTLLKSTEPPK